MDPQPEWLSDLLARGTQHPQAGPKAGQAAELADAEEGFDSGPTDIPVPDYPVPKRQKTGFQVLVNWDDFPKYDWDANILRVKPSSRAEYENRISPKSIAVTHQHS